MLTYIHNIVTFLQEGLCMQLNRFKIKEAMTRMQIDTQTQLAKKMGITKNQLSVMLSGRFNPIKSNVLNLCNVLKISPLEILSEKTPINEQVTLDFPVNKKINSNNALGISPDINVLELFAGAGGLALGLEQSGLNTVALIEIDKSCCETLRFNRPNWNIINEDICNVDFTMYSGHIHVVTGGFPCQAFSYAGKKLGFEDTRGTLFYEFARCIKETAPMLFMAENVRGLISHDKGRTLNTILSILGDLGYDVTYELLNAVNHGIPQKRERVIIVGTLPGVQFNFPEESEDVKVLRDALKDVPPSDGMQYSANKRKVLELVPPGGYWRDLPIEIQKSYMGKSFYSSGGRTGMARRIAWDEPCLTLTCSPSQKQTERCHPDETRPFTIREYARIQTFPDEWKFIGSISNRYKQIGNAVPVKLGYKLGNEIFKAIDEALQPNLINAAGKEIAATC